jgi:hypothetical protein
MMRVLRVGVLAGIVAGAVMAVWSMAAMWVTGSGFWLPLNLIAHTFHRSAPLDARFSAPALVIGLAVHMTVASIFGIAITGLAQRLRRTRTLVIVGGLLFTAVVWPVMQWGVWYSIDEPAAEGFKEWIFAGAHLIFGVAAAGFASIAVADDETVTRERGRHAAGRTAVPPAAAPENFFLPESGVGPSVRPDVRAAGRPALRPAPSRAQIDPAGTTGSLGARHRADPRAPRPGAGAAQGLPFRRR